MPVNETTRSTVSFTIVQEAREAHADGTRLSTRSGSFATAEAAFALLDAHRHDWFTEEDGFWSPAYVERATITTIRRTETERVER